MTNLFGLLFWGLAFAENPNCTLTVRYYKEDGKTEVKIIELYTPTRAACRTKMKEHKEPPSPEITKVIPSFKWLGKED